MTVTELLQGDNEFSEEVARFRSEEGPVVVREKAWWVPTPKRFTTTLWGTIHWSRGMPFIERVLTSGAYYWPSWSGVTVVKLVLLARRKKAEVDSADPGG